MTQARRWKLTVHAAQRARELGVSRHELLELLRAPRSVENGRTGDTMIYRGNELRAVVSHKDDTVISVDAKQEDRVLILPYQAPDRSRKDVPAVERIARHARERAQEMGLTVDQLRRCLADPDFTRRGGSQYGEEYTTFVSLADQLAIPVADDGTAVTVLWYRESRDRRFVRA